MGRCDATGMARHVQSGRPLDGAHDMLAGSPNEAIGVGVQPLAAQPHYSAAKAAVINITVSLAKELANSGITVNTVTPGPIMTAGWVEWARGIASARGWVTIWRRSSTISCRRSSRTLLDGWDASMTLPAPWRSSRARSPAS